MNPAPAEVWPWLALAGLGAFHGLNPAMGWLFAVALGLNLHDRRVVWISPLPIALGHALSITAAAAVFLALGTIIDPRLVRIVCGLVLIGWAFYHWRYGHRHRVRFGMRTGLLGLAVWSFLMATAHGAGLMLWPALMPLCFPAGSASAASNPVAIAVMGIGVHMAAMLIATTIAAVTVYEWAGLEILRHGWINVDLIWTIVLLATGVLLLLI
jgi:hypothetical protein